MIRPLLVLFTLFALVDDVAAQARKPEPGATGQPVKATPQPAGEKPAAPSAKPLPMNSRADEIDLVARTFTHHTREGKKVKHVITDGTLIKQGDAPAKLEDLKVGDMVAGSRMKRNADGTEYEVIKITKFRAKQK